MLLPVLIVHFVLVLSSIPLYGCFVYSFSFVVDIWVVSSLEVL